MDLGPPELLLILAVVIIVFGVGKLPEVGSALGKGIREFRKATSETDNPPETLPAAQKTQELVAGAVCASCSAANPANANFCGNCGSRLKKATIVGGACPHCGTLNSGENKFCLSCGAALTPAPVS